MSRAEGPDPANLSAVTQPTRYVAQEVRSSAIARDARLDGGGGEIRRTVVCETGTRKNVRRSVLAWQASSARVRSAAAASGECTRQSTDDLVSGAFWSS